MPRHYYPSKFHLDNRVRYFLWSSEVEGEDDIDRDQVWTQNGIAPTFATLAFVDEWARQQLQVSFVDEGEPILHDLSSVARWLRLKKSRSARQIPLSKCLAAWNIFSDLARGLETHFSGDAPQHFRLKDKLYGDSLRWMLVDPNQRFHFSGAEIQTLHDVLDEGLKLWRAHVR